MADSTLATTPLDSTALLTSDNRLWEKLAFGIARSFIVALSALFGLAGLYQFGCIFGTLEWLINFKRRRRFSRTLEEILQHKPSPSLRRNHTREFFMRTRCDKLFVLVLDSIPRERVANLLTIENRELLDAALTRGRGAYLALSHFGPQHIIGTLMAINGYRSVGVRDRNEGAIRKYVQNRLRRKYPEIQRLKMLFADSFPREIYRCFEEGYLLGSAIDVSRVREAHHKVEEVTLFGQQRFFPTGPMRIALHCAAPVLQAWIIPEKNFRYRFEIIEMLIDPADASNDSSAITNALHRYAANIEHRAKQHPELVTRV